MSQKFCHKCGTELPERAKFCPVCGERVNLDITQEGDNDATEAQEVQEVQEAQEVQGAQESQGQGENMESPDTQESHDGQDGDDRDATPQYDYYGEEKNGGQHVALFAVLGALAIIVLGFLAYSYYKDKRAARLAREQFVRDSIETVRRDSIMTARRIEKEREDSIRFANELPKRIKDAYIRKLDECNREILYVDLSMSEYFLYDINKDGIPELWIDKGTCEADRKLTIYTYLDEELINIYEIGTSHTGYHKGKGYILLVNGWMGCATWEKLAYNGQKITKEKVFEEDFPPYSSDRDYTEPNEPMIEMHRTTDKTPVINMEIKPRQS